MRMQKQEFEQLIQTTIPDEEYRIIEKVYVWHPAISNMEGKSQIADLYRDYGMAIIKNMEETADTMIELDRQEQDIRKQPEGIRERKVRVAAGNLSYERARSAVEKAFNVSGAEADFRDRMNFLKTIFGSETVVEVEKDLGYV